MPCTKWTNNNGRYCALSRDCNAHVKSYYHTLHVVLLLVLYVAGSEEYVLLCQSASAPALFYENSCQSIVPRLLLPLSIMPSVPDDDVLIFSEESTYRVGTFAFLIFHFTPTTATVFHSFLLHPFSACLAQIFQETRKPKCHSTSLISHPRDSKSPETL